ncbi:tRNA (cytidine(32)/uridine(32)-2'-O)-methyltransferase [hydrothermal vent metagenome]|uniref:tRNA (Cytidine(32)/uridine(32)-2'-O)-methyltransferase n=1 Tax=hydrothermal vent metagenome TaxID=652676 RepID=A0A3B1B3F5_9ZZZZ
MRLNNIRIVLIGTTHPGNIGAVARAMKNMCLEQLYLVEPKEFPCAEATARASGADDLLAKAKVCANLDEALEGCSLVVGASARMRSVAWPQFAPRDCAGLMLAESVRGHAALVFGRESSGLTNAEMDRCQYLVHIPSNEQYSSLNLSMAVQVLAYELYVTALDREAKQAPSEREVATADLMEGFIQHLEQTMEDIGFSDPRQSDKLLRRLRRLFNRARPDADELNILRGILSAAQGCKSQRRRS